MKVLIRDKQYELVMPNPLGLDIAAVLSKMEGSLGYIGTLPLFGTTTACFYDRNPNREKQHKDIMLLFFKDGDLYVSGLDQEAFQLLCTRPGKACDLCRQIIYSTGVHDYRECYCGNVMVDGGDQYFRSSLNGLTVSIDFLTKEVSELNATEE